MRVGELRVDAISDGAFVARPRYFGDDVPASARPDVFERDGAAWLPIGCFVVRTTAADGSDRTVLVDAGLGPALDPMPDGMLLVGGQLLTGLRTLGIAPGDIGDVVVTHFHTDHVGWLFDPSGRATFPNARIWFGAGEWAHFVEGSGEMAPHIREGFRTLAGTPRLVALDAEREVAPGVRAVPAPGHTPGHLAVVVESSGERLVLLGDAITVPEQLAETGWHSMGDVDAELAGRSRRVLWDLLAEEAVRGVGAHFPELRPGRVADGRWVPSGEERPAG
ncbi:MBL fold metallo-hydrolase [Leifsonia sp. fls2-241-R2A-40a]|uniref:MBL fold metallo-hydrolase n=1 Tax=Leifsonia sp. fls2-241-R2A-40a TaxID=3040290 RepID=UPI00254FEA4F|nr:MBL fold metallo-hydrolase [Leifsonia sp. fls2-241-R2A-40a]